MSSASDLMSDALILLRGADLRVGSGDLADLLWFSCTAAPCRYR